MRVDLTDGQWAELRDPSRLTNKQRRPLQIAGLKIAKFDKDGTPTEVDTSDPVAVLDFGEALVLALVESWSFDKPVPSEDPASLDDMLGSDYDLIVMKSMDAWTEVQGEEAGKALTS